jgi:hypothetical protein
LNKYLLKFALQSDPPNYEEVVVVQVIGDKDESVQSGADEDAAQPTEDEQTKLV